MKKNAQKFVSNIWLIAFIMFNEIVEILEKLWAIIIPSTTLLPITFNSTWWYDFIVKLAMSIALMLIFRQYYQMKMEIELNKKQLIINTELARMFHQVLFEMQFKPNELMQTDYNELLNRTKEIFYKKKLKANGKTK